MTASSDLNIQVHRLGGISLTVSNAESSENFYRQVLGFDKVSEISLITKDYGTIQVVTLRLGDEIIHLMEYINLRGLSIPNDSQSNDLWFQHLAIVVSDMDRAYAHLRLFSINCISTLPQTIPPSNTASAGVKAFKFKDPDGHNLELIWFPPDKGKQKWHTNGGSPQDQSTAESPLFLGIDHSAITVANTEESINFYQNILGMKIKATSFNAGVTQALLDGLPEAEVRITSLEPFQGGLGIELLDYIVPGRGRAIPENWNSWDIAYMYLQLMVEDIDHTIDCLQQNQINFVFPCPVYFTEGLSSNFQACLIKDPSGHAILLIAE